eukprot:m.11079 g.11079  ORF g.11079 m.11079 type:complete len:95 (-) comp5665_c0_seq1:676-960(-)
MRLSLSVCLSLVCSLSFNMTSTGSTQSPDVVAFLKLPAALPLCLFTVSFNRSTYISSTPLHRNHHTVTCCTLAKVYRTQNDNDLKHKLKPNKLS